MTPLVFSAVLGAALLHALWNALVKGGADKYLAMGAVVIGHMPLATFAVFWAPPPLPASWPYIGVGILLHAAYQVFLLRAYRVGDLTQVYPIARGSAPLLVAAISVLFLEVHLSQAEILAVMTIGAGILSMSLVRQADGLRNGHAARLALTTGVLIASYSLVDGLGARLSGSALGFYGWVAIGNGLLFTVFTAFRAPSVLVEIPRQAKRVFLVGGSASFAAYGLVIWSFTQAPIALVTALRETSIVFALVIGVFFLKERLDLAKVFSTMVTVFGAILLRFSKSF